jgi:glutamine cyclotransferase
MKRTISLVLILALGLALEVANADFTLGSLATVGPDASCPAYRCYKYEVVNSYPHDQSAFTQGLVFEDGFLYEGTGLYGGSTLRKVELETGAILRRCTLAADYFGEGILFSPIGSYN